MMIGLSYSSNYAVFTWSVLKRRVMTMPATPRLRKIVGCDFKTSTEVGEPSVLSHCRTRRRPMLVLRPGKRTERL